MRPSASVALFALFAIPVPFVRAQVKPNNLAAASTSGALSALKYTKVGSTGSYNQVTDIIPGTFPTCSANPFCITTPKQISGNLAPFDDEMTVVFRGPMNLYDIAVYQSTNASSASWNKVSSWTAGQQPSNLVFMNNNGGDASGEWSICAGSSQSYANGAWTDATTAPNKEVANGFLDEDHEMNIMTATSCQEISCAGFSRGTANHGWSGSKFFVFTFDMPSSSSSTKTPAIWALNAQIVRAAQYGCNCRGTGPQGCGELDILEVLNNDPSANINQAISEIYSPKGATGTGSGGFFARPTDGKVTYGVIFDVQTDQIAIQRYTQWDYTQGQITRSLMEGYLSAPALVVPFDGSGANGKREDVRSRMFGAHRRRHHSMH
ncbi:putative TOS1-like glycosyl hydrolase-domain-containing protein [Dichomitus squalens]|uniref:glucan endo-1,3-beta-D-glucosidase n=1 Tax=Dichomitus squalens TaxID=114155 RepID=A0A4Q9P3S1_9APHY|nr:putative TOS1-like glycosyl hydrolase-domain-containing protein [Dichomitus squalens]TBU46646.1 putative TOS1-like glycosyl hydrolase-domain-containing protein [Dichomitus squalens]